MVCNSKYIKKRIPVHQIRRKDIFMRGGRVLVFFPLKKGSNYIDLSHFI